MRDVAAVSWEHFLHIVIGRRGRHAELPDLRALPSRRVAVERTQYLVNDRERRNDDDRLYVLRRSPRSRRNPASVAVFSNGRNIGYLPDAVATRLAPLLDRIGGVAIVNGTGTRAGSIRLWVDLPGEAALAGFVAAASIAG